MTVQRIVFLINVWADEPVTKMNSAKDFFQNIYLRQFSHQAVYRGTATTLKYVVVDFDKYFSSGLELF